MTRNQLSPDVLKKFSDNVMFTVDGNGNITPTATQYVRGGATIVTQQDPSSLTVFSGQVCARQAGVCKCSTLVGVSSGSHMAITTGYTISSGLPADSEFEIYAVTSSGGTIANTTNGTIHIGD